MYRGIVTLAVSLALCASIGGCHRRAAQPPPVAAMPPPPPPPCDVVGSWLTDQPLPFGPQQIDIAPGDRAGVYLVRARNGATVGSATVANAGAAPVDTQLTNPVYRCAVGNDCNAMTCAFTGGVAPATFHRTS
jgi:hypothetical protein